VALDDDIFLGDGFEPGGAFHAWAMDMEGVPVPEPATGTMLIAGVLGLAIAGGRRAGCRS
jgi:hypothetical protein